MNPVYEAMKGRGMFVSTKGDAPPPEHKAPIAVWAYAEGDSLIYSATDPDEDDHHDQMTCQVVRRIEGFTGEDGTPIWTHGSQYFVAFACGCRIPASAHKLRAVLEEKYPQ
jgi:hypothetical protein